MRPSTWSPEISRRRSGWCSTTCEGAWPGVSCTCQAPRSVTTSTPGDEVAVGREAGPIMPPSSSWRRSAQRAQRRLGHAALARDLDPPLQGRLAVAAAVEVLVARVDPQLAARARLRSPRPGRSGRVGVGADEQPHVLEPQADLVQRALEVAIEPRSCIPESTSTMPSPAASAQALQCGTPGQGSGSRSRQTPGTTRSPRPASVRRVGLPHRRGRVPLRAMAADARSVVTALFRRARAP